MAKNITLLLILFCYGNAYSQKIDSLLEVQRLHDPQEKAYVQFDKNYYNPGETIWYKAYLFTGIDPSEASKNFYAEWVDENGRVIRQQSAPVNYSGAAGSFDIDSTYNKNLIYFKAYTVPMLNGDTNFLFTKAVRILSTKATAPKAVAPQPPTISFMPEGGDWVYGLPSNMAFIATDQKGLPVAVSGTVTNNAGTKVADFKTLQNGMGRFPLVAEDGKTYTASWKPAGGAVITTPLPVPKLQGATLAIAEEGEKKRFTIHRSQAVSEAQKQLHIVGYMNQRLVFQANVNLADKPMATGVFSTKSLPTGILQITLFDNAYKPLAERVCFVNNHDYEFDADVYFSQKSLTARGVNGIEITMSDTLPANLSLSITDADLNESNPLDDNIISHMLLTGDLRGKIVNPYYYFFSNADSAAYHLDLVMLTHGWRRYNWDAVLAGRVAPTRYKESNYLSINGQLAGLPQGSFGSGLQLVGILQTADSAKTFISLPVDRQGKVSTEGLLFYDKAKLYFNFNKKNLSFDKGMLMIDNGLYKAASKAAVDSSIKIGMMDIANATIASNAKINKLAMLSRQQQLLRSGMLENVTIKTRTKTAKEKMEEKYVGGLFAGDGNSFDLVNDPLAGGYMDVFQYLQGRVAGLQITSGGANGTTLSWRGGTPALYLNEMQADVSMVSSTPVSDIAYIKVLRPGESIATGGGGGVIAIYTRRGGDTQPGSNTKGLSYVQLEGYSPMKQFYSPDYTTAADIDVRTDVRTTLYWNPLIYVDKIRKRVRLKFYNNDVTKHFRVIMEGMNGEGKLFHVEKEIGN